MRLILPMMLIAAAGCDLAFDLERPPLPDGLLAYERCGPFLYDEPLRYTTITNPNGGELGPAPWSWNDARTACLQRGMDLAVFNDEHELGTSDATLWPYWIGLSRTGSAWTTVDECPAMMPAGGDANGCGVVSGPNSISETTCTGAMTNATPEEPQVVLGALCETPRPEADGCLGNSPATTDYVMSPTALAYSAARDFCRQQGGHPVVFETHAEWLAVAARVRDDLHQKFWVGSTFDGTRWKNDNACPADFVWAAGAPSRTPVANDCMGSVVLELPDEESGPVMTLTGVDPIACSAPELFALCEVSR